MCFESLQSVVHIFEYYEFIQSVVHTFVYSAFIQSVVHIFVYSAFIQSVSGSHFCVFRIHKISEWFTFLCIQNS